MDKIIPNKIMECNINKEGESKLVNLKCRIDTMKELDYYKAGGILQYVLNSIVEKAS